MTSRFFLPLSGNSNIFVYNNYDKDDLVSTFLLMILTFLLIILRRTKFRENLLKLSKEKNISIRKLEREAGLHVNFLSNLIADEKRSPRVDALVSIADVLEVSLDELVGREFYRDTAQYKKIVENEELFLEILRDLTQRLQQNPEISYNFHEIYNYIFVYYQFCLQHNSKIDFEFGDYLFKKSF